MTIVPCSSECLPVMATLLLLLIRASTTYANFTSGIDGVVSLLDGHVLPVVGLGVALTEDATFNAVTYALSVGYRLIDTAAEESYGNEDQVGHAIRKFYDNDTDGSSVYVTTKLWDSDHGFWETLHAFDESFFALNLTAHPESNPARNGTIDLYLMHSPFGGHIVETWDAMLYLRSKNYVNSVGVSNFGIPHLRLLRDHGRPLPAVNQIELHPLVYRRRLPLIQWCRDHGIRVQAYGSLLHGYSKWLADPLLTRMADRYDGRTVAQILLRWALQHEFLIIPKSSRRWRILENSRLYDFELTAGDMDTLDRWGDAIAEPEERNVYKRDWNWNPIDEAPVHEGATHYWPHFKGVDEVYFAADEYDYEDGEKEDDEEL